MSAADATAASPSRPAPRASFTFALQAGAVCATAAMLLACWVVVRRLAPTRAAAAPAPD